jgi:hypothetical protein
MPFAFRCGRLVVLMLDSRGDRDVFREELPVLGAEQWGFIDHVLQNLPPDVEALAVVTPTPIASVDPDGQGQKLVGARTDDVELFKKGDLEGLLNLRSEKSFGDVAAAVTAVHLSRLTGRQLNLGQFQVSNIDEARDQWSHRFARKEQTDLLRKAAQARLNNRTPASARGLIFLSGDIHVGCNFELTFLAPPCRVTSLTSSGISNVEDVQPIVGSFVDEDFSLGFGIQSSLKEVINRFNFGVVQVIPTGAGARMIGTVAHEGNAVTLGLDINVLL